jgi:hypothetical protein
MTIVAALTSRPTIERVEAARRLTDDAPATAPAGAEWAR